MDQLARPVWPTRRAAVPLAGSTFHLARPAQPGPGRPTCLSRPAMLQTSPHVMLGSITPQDPSAIILEFINKEMW